MRAALLLLAVLLPAGAARAADTYVARMLPLADEKAVFATVESRNIVPARARIGGTLADLSARVGDEVRQGQTLAMVGDEKLDLQLRSLDAQIAGLRAQVAEAQVEFDRFDALAKTGAASRQQYDQARTALNVATSALAARTAERGVVAQQMSEGAVLAPTAGRVLEVPVTRGAVLLPGEAVARIAEADYVLRLAVPERHAQLLHTSDTIRLNGADVGGRDGPEFGRITLIYPQIQDGRVIADATVPGLGSYFVGRRIQVWIGAGERQSFVIPGSFVEMRFGLSYVRRRVPSGTEDVPVQLGRDMPTPALPNGVEVLSGLQTGDVLVAP